MSLLGSQFFAPAWQLRKFDQFTDADATALTAHTLGPLNVGGGSWTTSGTGATISGNRATGTNPNNKLAVAGSSAGIAVECALTASTTAGIIAVEGTSTVGSEHTGIQIQTRPDATNDYIRAAIIAGQGVVIYDNNAGTANCIRFILDAATYATGTTHVLRFSRVGDVLTLSRRDGEVYTELYSGTYSTAKSYTDVGIVGVTNTGTKFWEDFKAMVLAPPS